MINNQEFQANLDMDAAIILANIKFDNQNPKEIEESEDYILIESPIDRINYINY